MLLFSTILFVLHVCISVIHVNSGKKVSSISTLKCSGLINHGSFSSYNDLHIVDESKGMKLVYIRTRGIRLAMWNMCILTGKVVEIVDVMRRSKIDISCLVKTQ